MRLCRTEADIERTMLANLNRLKKQIVTSLSASLLFDKLKVNTADFQTFWGSTLLRANEGVVLGNLAVRWRGHKLLRFRIIMNEVDLRIPCVCR